MASRTKAGAAQPDGVPDGAATASSVNQTVKLPRWRKAVSQAAEFMTFFCLGT